MGLDIVEFLMEVEETFAIRIPDREAEKILTPRMLMTWGRISESKRRRGQATASQWELLGEGRLAISYPNSVFPHRIA
jgi:hypothetical protein